MPEAIHRAKHRAVERPPAEVARSRSVEARDSRLTRIAGTPDAWLDVALHRRADDAFAATADTLDLLMNCNADSLVVFTHRVGWRSGGPHGGRRVAAGSPADRFDRAGLLPFRCSER
jgi:hypothetical protein